MCEITPGDLLRDIYMNVDERWQCKIQRVVCCVCMYYIYIYIYKTYIYIYTICIYVCTMYVRMHQFHGSLDKSTKCCCCCCCCCCRSKRQVTEIRRFKSDLFQHIYNIATRKNDIDFRKKEKKNSFKKHQKNLI